MKTELEKKLNKLPDTIIINKILFGLSISKVIWDNNECIWYINYKDAQGNTILEVEHQSLQAAVDTTLKEIKSL